MKISIISHFPPVKGGISIYSKRTADEFIKQKQVVQYIPVNSLKNVLNLFNKLKKFNPTIIRLDYTISMYGIISIFLYFLLLIYKFVKKIPIIVNYHEVKRDTDLLGKFGVYYYRIFSQLFDFIFVHTNESKNILIHQCKMNPSKIKVIPLGLYTFNNTNNLKEELYKKYHLENKKYILYFGYIHIDKGIEYLIQAFNHLVTTDPKSTRINLIIAGSIRRRSGILKIFEAKDLSYLSELNQISINLGLKNNIKFLGEIEEKYIYTLLKNSEIIVIPYTNTESSGVLNQALTVRVPIIASNIGGLKETLNDVGILVPKKDFISISKEIYKLIHNINYRKSIIESYITLYEKLNQEVVIKNTLNEYCKLLNINESRN